MEIMFNGTLLSQKPFARRASAAASLGTSNKRILVALGDPEVKRLFSKSFQKYADAVEGELPRGRATHIVHDSEFVIGEYVILLRAVANPAVPSDRFELIELMKKIMTPELKAAIASAIAAEMRPWWQKWLHLKQAG